MSTTSFLTNENVNLLWEVLKEEEILKNQNQNTLNQIVQIFKNNLQGFYESERNKCISLVDINKKYIIIILKYINQNYPINLIHNEKSFLPLVKEKFDLLKMPYYVTRGNHDMVTPEYWNSVWGTPLNHDVVVKDNGILLGDTSNEQGVYLSPDLSWLNKTLESHKDKKQVFIFLHIPQAKWTKNGISTPEVFDIIKKYPNVKAVFHGHEHDQDGFKMVEKVPYIFDAHVGGNWGTPYKGFRVVELLKDNSMITYMMNPTDKLNELSF